MKTLMMFLAVLLVGCSGKSESKPESKSGSKSGEKSVSKSPGQPQIRGSWFAQMPGKSRNVSEYTFQEDGTMTIAFGSPAGTYEFDSSKTPAMLRTGSRSNGQQTAVSFPDSNTMYQHNTKRTLKRRGKALKDKPLLGMWTEAGNASTIVEFRANGEIWDRRFNEFKYQVDDKARTMTWTKQGKSMTFRFTFPDAQTLRLENPANANQPPLTLKRKQ